MGNQGQQRSGLANFHVRLLSFLCGDGLEGPQSYNCCNTAAKQYLTLGHICANSFEHHLLDVPSNCWRKYKNKSRI
jgi:hypothetical protein